MLSTIAMCALAADWVERQGVLVRCVWLHGAGVVSSGPRDAGRRRTRPHRRHNELGTTKDACRACPMRLCVLPKMNEIDLYVVKTTRVPDANLKST